MKTIKEMTAIMQAFADGKTIEMYIPECEDWRELQMPSWDWNHNDYRVKPENLLPTTWEEFCNTYPIKEGEAFINYYSIIREYTSGEHRDAEADKNLLPNKETADAMLALCQLIQLRNCYNEGWEPNWEDEYNAKYCIIFDRNDITPMSRCTNAQILTFKTEELRDEFLKNFKELIKIAKPLI